jgi:SAM-dependent methyltransferase
VSEQPLDRAARLLAAEQQPAGLADRLRRRLAGRKRLELDAALLQALQELSAQRREVGPDEWKGPAAWDRIQPLATAARLTVEGPDGELRLGYDEGQRAEASVYRGFEDVFRGPEALIREHQQPYVEILRDHPPALDVGCGRGELLDLLAERGISAHGVDVDAGMVARCRDKGHDVSEGDALDHLEDRPDASLGSIFCAHVIEHLPFRDLVRFLALARTKLVPGGALVMETVNPHSLVALRAFWLDLTHQVPVYPEVALTLCRLQGFAAAHVMFPRASARGELEADLRDEDAYAVVATNAAG